MNSLRSRSRTKYMFAYWYLKVSSDLDLIANEGVKFVRGRTSVVSRVMGAGGTVLTDN